jgi:alpha/beta superfamily hydrolase
MSVGTSAALSERRLVAGAAGAIEIALDWPPPGARIAGRLRGLACIGHPHPLFGGTFDNKVAATIARAFAMLGWLAVRPNFRGVGRSEGSHDDGNGETEDFLQVIRAVPQYSDVAAEMMPDPTLALAGFSFGSFVAARAAAALAGARPPAHLAKPPAHLVLVGAAAGKWPLPAVAPGTLVIHGELDETIPLAAVFDWARPLDLPVVVIPGADHFFHRRLTLLKSLIVRHVTGVNPGESLPAE